MREETGKLLREQEEKNTGKNAPRRCWMLGSSIHRVELRIKCSPLLKIPAVGHRKTLAKAKALVDIVE